MDRNLCALEVESSPETAGVSEIALSVATMFALGDHNAQGRLKNVGALFLIEHD